MAASYLELSGLWSKSTARGEVLTARLTPAVRQQILSALTASDGLAADLVVMPSKYRMGKLPTHTLLVSIDRPAPPSEAD